VLYGHNRELDLVLVPLGASVLAERTAAPRGVQQQSGSGFSVVSVSGQVARPAIENGRQVTGSSQAATVVMAAARASTSGQRSTPTRMTPPRIQGNESDNPGDEPPQPDSPRTRKKTRDKELACIAAQLKAAMERANEDAAGAELQYANCDFVQATSNTVEWLFSKSRKIRRFDRKSMTPYV